MKTAHSTKVPVIVSETNGTAENELVYIKFPDKNEILRLNSSLKPSKSLSKRFVGVIRDVFLPCGYPNSVSEDYTQYQIWDTVQACASTLSGTLTTKSILQSVGVGDSKASAVSAAVTWILKDGTGMTSRILFAWVVGSGLDYNCKKWRLFADITNDVAMFVELTVLPLYSEYALQILCLTTSLKGLVGVAGGATRAAITQHQAINQNMADVSAKDGSQETCVNLLTSFLGLALLSTVTDIESTWFIFIAMTCLHLYANFKAVKSLNFKYFNEHRLALAIKDYIITENVPHYSTVNKNESVFLFKGLNDKLLCGHRILMGHSLSGVIASGAVMPFQLKFLTHLYKDRKYLIVHNDKCERAHVGLAKDYCPVDVIEAYFHAVFIGLGTLMLKSPNSLNSKDLAKSQMKPDSIMNKLRCLVSSKSKHDAHDQLDLGLILAIDQFASKYSSDFIAQARKIGWDLDRVVVSVEKWRTEWREENLNNEERLILKND